MRILIAPDAFKGSLSSTQAASAMATGIRKVNPDADIETMPLADGGEGTLDVLLNYESHEENDLTNEKYVIYREGIGGYVALIESARCLGLTLPEMQRQGIWQRGSGVLGECIRQNLDAGIRCFVIALGGSGTNDGGLGMLVSLGLHVLDAQGKTVSPSLQGLTEAVLLDVSGLDARLACCELTILCDVDAPLCGPVGATHTFGPQKGLSSEQLSDVDREMERFAIMVESAFGIKARGMSGSGAAGGLGFAFAVLGGRLVSGAEYVIEKAGLAERMEGCDWVVTGEGRSDAQTLAGKLPLKVAEAAKVAGTKVALISGSVDQSAIPALEKRFDRLISAQPEGMSDDQAINQAISLLAHAAKEFGKMIG